MNKVKYIKAIKQHYKNRKLPILEKNKVSILTKYDHFKNKLLNKLASDHFLKYGFGKNYNYTDLKKIVWEFQIIKKLINKQEKQEMKLKEELKHYFNVKSKQFGKLTILIAENQINDFLKESQFLDKRTRKYKINLGIYTTAKRFLESKKGTN